MAQNRMKIKNNDLVFVVSFFRESLETCQLYVSLLYFQLNENNTT